MTQTFGEGRVTAEKEGEVLLVTVARPEARNALDIETIVALQDLIGTLEHRSDIASVIIASEGEDVFIAGGDLRQFARLKGERAGDTLSSSMGSVTSAIECLPQVVVAAIEGNAYGGGVELALACDLRVMSRGSSLVFAQSKFGLSTAWGGAARLVDAVGYSTALDLLLFGKAVDADACLAMKLTNRVVEPGHVVEEALSMGHRIADLGWGVATGIKEVVLAGALSERAEALGVERAIFAKLWAAEAHESKVREFMSSKWTK